MARLGRLPAEMSTIFSAILILLHLVIQCTVPITAEDINEQRTSIGMFLFPGGQSHGFDIAEVAMELVERGFNVYVSMTSFDVKPFRQYIGRSSAQVDIHFYDGHTEVSSQAHEDAKLWIVKYDLEVTDEVKEFESSWLQQNLESHMNYTSELYDDMWREYALQKFVAMQQLNDAEEGLREIFKNTARQCRDLMKDSRTASIFSSLDMFILDPAVHCGMVNAVRFKKPFALALFGSFYPHFDSSSWIQPWVPTFNSGILPMSMTAMDAIRNLKLTRSFKTEFIPAMWKDLCPLMKAYNIDANISTLLPADQCTRVREYAYRMSIARVYFTELDAPRELFPIEHFVGSLTSRPAVPLPTGTDGIAEFITSATRGFIYISLGTIATFEMERMLRIRDAVESFGSLRAVWKITGYMSEEDKAQLQRSGRIMLTQWTSQNDLLGHPNILAFFTHAGRHSLEEGAYHGVPLLMMPLFADQNENMHIGLGHNLGIGLDQHEFTSESVSSALEDLIARASDVEGVDSPYFIAAQHLSARLQSHPRRPIKRAGDIFERTITEVMRIKKYGGDPLMLLPRVIRMSYSEYLSPFIMLAGIFFGLVTLSCVLVIGALYLLIRSIHSLRSFAGNVDIFFIFSKNSKKDV